MVKIIYKVLCCMFILSLISCSLFVVPHKIRSNIEMCYSDSINNCKVKFDGYYIAKESGKFENFIFFKNGIVNYNSYKDIESEIKSLNSKRDNNIKKVFYTSFLHWGLYSVSDDTIYVRLIWNPGQGNYGGNKIKFKIQDDSTIIKVSNFPLVEDDFYQSYYVKMWIGKKYRFKKLSQLPSSNCWLKNEKWFWCDKEKWRQYKKNFESKR